MDRIASDRIMRKETMESNNEGICTCIDIGGKWVRNFCLIHRNRKCDNSKPYKWTKGGGGKIDATCHDDEDWDST